MLGPVSTRMHMWRLRHLLDGNLVCLLTVGEAIAEGGKVEPPRSARWVPRETHHGASYPSVPDAFAVGRNSRQPKERLEAESGRTPHVLTCAYRSLAHVLHHHSDSEPNGW